MEGKKHVFSVLDKKMFLEIIKKYSYIIENRNTSSATSRRKNEAWDMVAKEFNTNPLATSQATHKQLRRWWMNIKQRRREALIKERKRRMGTGGESSTSDADIDPDISIAAIPEIILCNSPNTESPVVEAATTYESPLTLTTLQRKPKCVLTNKPSSHTPMSATKVNIREKEYKDRQTRANEKHELVLQILREQLRENKAKADLAELILKKKNKCLDSTG